MTITNKDRAQWAAEALRKFMALSDTTHDESLGDLLCDLMHFADDNNFDFKAALNRARGHYAEEYFEKGPDSPATTPYMATFNIPAGNATEVFYATSPEQALQMARKYADDPQVTEADFDPIAEKFCVREIVITDEDGQQHAVWQTDEYRLQLAAPKLLEALEGQIEITRDIIDAWKNTDHLYGAVEDLISELDSKSQWAQELLRASDRCDLTAPIEDLEKSLDENLATIAQAKGGAA